MEDLNYYQPESGEESEADTETEIGFDGEEFETEVRNVIRKLIFKHFALELERFGVTNIAASHIATALLMDFNLVSKDDTRMVIDHQKIKRCRDAMH